MNPSGIPVNPRYVKKRIKIGIFGGSGFLGSNLAKALSKNPEVAVTVFTRKKKPIKKFIDYKNIFFEYSFFSPSAILFENFDVLVNLSGESIIGTWSEQKKDNIKTSRTVFTKNIIDELVITRYKPRLFIQASAVGFYGSYFDDSLSFDESSPQGQGFLAKLCKDWERSTERLTEKGIRVIHTRIGLVLDSYAGALRNMIWGFKLFLGGWAGEGKQIVSWIHIDDFVQAMIHLMNKELGNIEGPVNLCSPNPVSNFEFSKTIGNVLHRPCKFQISPFIINSIFGEGSEIVLKGQRVVPKKLLESGYKFIHPNIDESLENLLKKS